MDNILNGLRYTCFKYDSMKVLFLVITSFWCLALYWLLKVNKFAIE